MVNIIFLALYFFVKTEIKNITLSTRVHIPSLPFPGVGVAVRSSWCTPAPSSLLKVNNPPPSSQNKNGITGGCCSVAATFGAPCGLRGPNRGLLRRILRPAIQRKRECAFCEEKINWARTKDESKKIHCRQPSSATHANGDAVFLNW